MFQFDYSNLFKITTEHGLSSADFDSWATKFSHYKELILSRKQGFLDLPEDTTNLNKIQKFADSIKGNFEYIVILGIGGSMLGPQTILAALDTNLDRQKSGRSNFPKILTADNADPFLIADVAQQVDLTKTLFLVQTKSGGTPETLSQYFYFRDLVSKANLKIKNHFVFVTDPNNGYLRKITNQENIPSFEIPENVGGRFSVLTSVGLLISSLVGLDTKNMLKGAKEAKQVFFEGQNLNVYNLALAQYLFYEKSKPITVLMPYCSRLKKFADWYTQLLSESIGKEKNLAGQIVNIGLTPVPSLGATDQHSQAQLFKEGPNDKLIIFIEVKNYGEKVVIPEIYGDEPKFSYLKNKTFNDLISAELVGTSQSFTESEKPNLSIIVDRVDEFNLGGLFMIFELATAFLGEILKINTYDQPGVERSKIITKEILESDVSF